MVTSDCAGRSILPGSVALDDAGAAYFTVTLSTPGTCALDGRPLTFVDDRPPPDPWTSPPPLYGHFLARVAPSPSGEAAVEWIDAWTGTSFWNSSGLPELAMLGAERLLVLRRGADSRLRELSAVDGTLLHETVFPFRGSGLSAGANGEPLFYGDFESGNLNSGPLQLGPFDDAPNAIVYQPAPNGGAAWAQAIVADETIRTAQWANYPAKHGVHLQSASFGGGRLWLTGTHWGNLWLRFTHQLPSAAGVDQDQQEPWGAVLQFAH